MTGDDGSDRFVFKGASANVTALGGTGRDFFVSGFPVSGDLLGGDGSDKFTGFANPAGTVVNLRGGPGADVYLLHGTNPAHVVEGVDQGRDTVVVARGVD